jgi:hypothetical protein
MARNDQESREQSQLFAVTIRGLEFAEIRDALQSEFRDAKRGGELETGEEELGR